MYDYEEAQVKRRNKAEKFGKGLFELSNNETDNGLVGPLNIVRLPSERSVPKTILKRSVNFNHGFNSVRGSLKSPNAAFNNNQGYQHYIMK
jgi:hypothetical protein